MTIVTGNLNKKKFCLKYLPKKSHFPFCFKERLIDGWTDQVNYTVTLLLTKIAYSHTVPKEVELFYIYSITFQLLTCLKILKFCLHENISESLNFFLI